MSIRIVEIEYKMLEIKKYLEYLDILLRGSLIPHVKTINNDTNDINKLLADILSPAEEGSYLNEGFAVKKQ